MEEVHTVIERAGKIAEIHEFLEANKDISPAKESKREAQNTIDKFTQFHKSLNDLENTDSKRTSSDELKAMHKKIDELHDKVSQVQPNNVTTEDIKEVHNHIHEALIAK